MAITFNTTTGVFSSATSATVSGTASAGSLLLVYIYWGTGLSGQSITRSSGTSWTALDGTSGANDSPGNGVEWCGYITNWAGGSFSTVFAEGGSSGKDGGWIVVECIGADTSASPLTFTPAASNFTSVHLMSNSDTGTTNTTDALVGFFGYSNSASPAMAADATANPTSGWTTTALQTGNSGNTPHGHAWAMYQALSSAVTNPKAAANTGSSNVSGRCILVVVKAGSSGNSFNTSLTDAQSALDSTALLTTKVLTPDAISALDSLSKVSFKTFLDWLSETDSVAASRLAVVSLSDRQSALDGLAKAMSRGLVDSFSEIDQFARVWQAHLALLDSISGLDSLAKMPAKTFGEWLSATDTVSAAKLAGTNWQRAISDSHSALDVLMKTPGKWTSDAISAVDLFSRVWTAHLTLQDWVSEADTWAKSVVKSNQDTFVATDTLTRTAQYFRTVVDGLSETDRLTVGRLLLVQLLDAAGLTDQVSTLIQHPLGQFALGQVISLVAAQLGMTISLLVGTALSQLLSNFAPGALFEIISNFSTSGLSQTVSLLQTGQLTVSLSNF